MKPKNILLYIQTEQTTIKKYLLITVLFNLLINWCVFAIHSCKPVVRYAFIHIYHVAFANNILSSRHQGKKISNLQKMFFFAMNW